MGPHQEGQESPTERIDAVASLGRKNKLKSTRRKDAAIEFANRATMEGYQGSHKGKSRQLLTVREVTDATPASEDDRPPKSRKGANEGGKINENSAQNERGFVKGR